MNVLNWMEYLKKKVNLFKRCFLSSMRKLKCYSYNLPLDVSSNKENDQTISLVL